jgi:ubiquinone/menaquinone biosynthesis C-methylase UbiE
MHISFIDLLVDPFTRQELKLIITEQEGEFIKTGEFIGSKTYPIIRGIPRFVEYDNYVRGFSFQWNKWSRLQFEDQNIGKPMQGHTTRMWEEITGITQQDLQGQIIGDFGCGSGRFIDVVKKRHGKVIGIDYSLAVEAAQKNFSDDKDVLIIQADVMNLPIRDIVLDGAYSIGVLHHTPDPGLGFSDITKTVKSGGWVGVCVYEAGGYYTSNIVKVYRWVFGKLSSIFGYRVPLWYSYFAVYCLAPFSKIPYIGRFIKYFLRNFLFPFIVLPDVRWSVLDTFDCLTTSYQSGHTHEEIKGWYQESDFISFSPSEWGKTAMHGIKQ